MLAPVDPTSFASFNGSEYFLATVWSPYSEDARKVLPTARQKELSARGVVPAQAEIILASK